MCVFVCVCIYIYKVVYTYIYVYIYIYRLQPTPRSHNSVGLTRVTPKNKMLWLKVPRAA